MYSFLIKDLKRHLEVYEAIINNNDEIRLPNN